MDEGNIPPATSEEAVPKEKTNQPLDDSNFDDGNTPVVSSSTAEKEPVLSQGGVEREEVPQDEDRSSMDEIPSHELVGEESSSSIEVVSLSGEEADQLWKNMLQKLREVGSIHLLSLLDRCENKVLGANDLHLKFIQAFDAHSVEEEEKKLASLLRELSGRNYTIHYEVMEQKKKEKEAPLDGQVEMIRQIFQGQIVKKGVKP